MSGCVESDLFSPYAAPGKYDFLDCPGITDRLKATTAREQQLVELMSRPTKQLAARSSMPSFIGMTLIAPAQTYASYGKQPKRNTARLTSPPRCDETAARRQARGRAADRQEDGDEAAV
jgi:hypothetical protein